MSMYFVSNSGETLWNPSNRVGLLFLRQIRVIEEVYGMDSGMAFQDGDTIELNRDKLSRFLNEILSILDRNNHKVTPILLRGCLSIAIALALKADIKINDSFTDNSCISLILQESYELIKILS